MENDLRDSAKGADHALDARAFAHRLATNQQTLTPEEMEQRVTTYSEYSISSNVGDIRNIESQTLSGIAVEKIFCFLPALLTSQCSTIEPGPDHLAIGGGA